MVVRGREDGGGVVEGGPGRRVTGGRDPLNMASRQANEGG